MALLIDTECLPAEISTMSAMQDLFVPTLNNQGYAAVKLDRFSERFAEYSEGQFLEIGAAYGYAAIEALKNGEDFIANDLDKRHLQHLEKEANRL